ncbi:MAG: hypothetical protein GFH24_608416n5 [Chloroflexi bacterium AL-N5]|jgi:transposase|nr:hypothetical protein [Chloroflexi bacterium AL-N5]
MAYSKDIRERIIKAYEAGQNKNAIAKRYEVSWWSVDSYIKRFKAGKLEADSPPGRPPSLDAEGCKVLAKQVAEHADWSLEEHGEALHESIGLRLKKSAIGNYLQKLNLRYKKKSLPE